MQRLFEQTTKDDAEILGLCFTAGRYVEVVTSECCDEKAHMEHTLWFAELISPETQGCANEEAARLVK